MSAVTIPRTLKSWGDIMSITPLPPAFPPSAPSAPLKKNRTNAIIIGAAVAVIAAIVGTGVVVVQSRDDDSKPSAAASASSTPDADVTDAAADTEPTYTTLDAGSFSIDLKTKSRQCFGSAGCNLTVEPDLTLAVDSGSVDPDAVYEITYEIHGDESGPVIETAELSERTSLNYTPTLIQTASASTKVSVEITDVTAQG
ncbi:hypothetical protein [Streptomyces sp. NPDC002088]|uniref:hypothetical protein n=1 Tax=Streptomyces sp. NPDC002088 TaxID=3154665 RepID=UPI0033209ACC